MPLTPEDIEALSQSVTRVIGQKIDEFDARVMARFDQVDQRFARIETRLDALEERMGALEARMGRLVGDITRGRTSDLERITALEARMAELEAKLEGKH